MDKVTIVTCVMAIQSISKKYSWFKPSVKDIGVLKIIENDDMKPLL